MNILLLPQDPLDEKGVFLEIIADPNQEESSIWAGDLVRMYARYGESKTEVGVQVLHQPTGIRITCTEARSRQGNSPGKTTYLEISNKQTTRDNSYL